MEQWTLGPPKQPESEPRTETRLGGATMHKAVIIPLTFFTSAVLGCGSEPMQPASGAAPTVTTPATPTTPSTVAGQPQQAATAGSPAGAAAGGAAPTSPVVGSTPTMTPGLPTTTTPTMAGATAGSPGTTPAMMPPLGDLPPATGKPIAKECQGFPLDGLVYSPGGSVTPNKCEAFHPTLNNPYAVRCVDAWPWWKTKFPGDNYCILPPPPDKGVQIGHHFQGEGNAWFDKVSKGDMTGYDNPPPDWTLAPGGEEEKNITIKYQNPAGNYYRIYSRMRGGSHHMIVSSVPSATTTFKWGPGGADGLFTGTGIPGAQRPDDNAPQSFEIPTEDKGLYREFPANAIVQYNVHHFNSTDNTILKEAWQNIWWEPTATTKVNAISGLPVTQVIGTFAEPEQIVDMHYASTVPAQMRVLGLFGHRHAWTTNFSAWVERPNQDPEVIYQSFDWFDEPTYTYNSQVKNPKPDWQKRVDGGHSGILMLNAGDKLHFNCHIEYTTARAKEENSPVMPQQNGTLRFANEAFNAEMCILFGAAVGDNGTPEQLGAPPDFAKAR